MAKKNEIPGFPPACERTLQILDCFISDPSPKTLKNLSEKFDIPLSSLYRIISCMQEYNYMTEDPARPNHFRLGYKCSQFSTAVYSQSDLIRLARPYMQELTYKSNQASQLCVLTEIYVCTIDQYLPRSAITYISELGEKLPVNVSASGKLLTALLPSARQKAFLERAFKKFRRNTPNTIADLDSYRTELKRIRELGYSTDHEEYALGIGCIAVPIFDSVGIPIAAIGVTGPINFYRDVNNFSTTLNSLFDISRQIQEQLH